MKNQFLKIEFLLSIIIHIALLFVFGSSLYQSSAFSMANQAIEISMEIVPEAQIAEASLNAQPIVEPVIEKAVEKVIPPKQIIKKKIQKKEIQPIQKQVVKNIGENKISENTQARANLGQSNGQTKAKPDYLKNPPPQYPNQSRRNREQGVVLLKVNISAQGKVNFIKLKKSSSYYRLDNAAIESVKNWSFKPARFAGIAIESDAIIPVKFVLND